MQVTTISSDAELDNFDADEVSLVAAMVAVVNRVDDQGDDFTVTWTVTSEHWAKGVIWNRGGIAIGQVAVLDQQRTNALQALELAKFVAHGD